MLHIPKCTMKFWPKLYFLNKSHALILATRVNIKISPSKTLGVNKMRYWCNFTVVWMGLLNFWFIAWNSTTYTLSQEGRKAKDWTRGKMRKTSWFIKKSSDLMAKPHCSASGIINESFFPHTPSRFWPLIIPYLDTLMETCKY